MFSLADGCSVICVMSSELTLTDSEKLSTRVAVFISRLNDSSSGLVLSAV